MCICVYVYPLMAEGRKWDSIIWVRLYYSVSISFLQAVIGGRKTCNERLCIYYTWWKQLFPQNTTDDSPFSATFLMIFIGSGRGWLWNRLCHSYSYGRGEVLWWHALETSQLGRAFWWEVGSRGREKLTWPYLTSNPLAMYSVMGILVPSDKGVSIGDGDDDLYYYSDDDVHSIYYGSRIWLLWHFFLCVCQPHCDNIEPATFLIFLSKTENHGNCIRKYW